VDPGLHRTGYGALAFRDGRPTVREVGVLSTSARAHLGDRLHHLYRDMEGLLRDLHPDVLVLEDLFVHGRFPRTAIVLGHARGIIYLAAAAAGVRIVELAPSAVKQAVAGTGRASKAQVQTAVRTLLGLRAVTNAHAADALALAYAGLYRTTSAVRLR
jgi:crossover junction endodeoxyribonuclease RuvC